MIEKYDSKWVSLATVSILGQPPSRFALQKHHSASRVDYGYMARAIKLAWRGLYTTDPNPRVGCVLVKNNQVIGEGWHRRAGEGHAEIEALASVNLSAEDATAYVTLEPCCHHGKTPPCTHALIDAGISKVVVAMEDPNSKVAGNGLQRLEAAGIDVVCGVLSEDAEMLNPGFIKRMRTERPWVCSKLAMSLDGRTALASGKSKWITGALARLDVHRIRARSSVILTGIGTVLMDNPSMNVRLPDNVEVNQPVRVIVDSQLRISPESKMVCLPGTTIVCTLNRDGEKHKRLEDVGFRVETLPSSGTNRVDLDGLFAFLGKLEVNEVLVEAGRTLNGALIQAGLVDELIVYVAPCLLGDEGRGLFDLSEISRMSDRIKLKLLENRQVGMDLRLRYRITTR